MKKVTGLREGKEKLGGIKSRPATLRPDPPKPHSGISNTHRCSDWSEHSVVVTSTIMDLLGRIVVLEKKIVYLENRLEKVEDLSPFSWLSKL